MVAQPIVNHDFLRASTMIVEPARHAASTNVKGIDADHQRHIKKVLHEALARCFGDLAHASRHRIEPWREARRQTCWIIAQ